jgi:manganese-dependent ADP-ribose/CDP-alcohol diphosphatase
MHKIVRHSFIILVSFFSLLLLFSITSCKSMKRVAPVNTELMPEGEKVLSIGLIADVQYTDESGNLIVNRYYDASLEKLSQCTTEFNTMNLDFVIQLGDMIDRDFKSYDEILAVYNSLTMPHYSVLGNHDYSVSDDKKALVPGKLGMQKPYYDFALKGWRFIVLDGNDISLFAATDDSPAFEDALTYYKVNDIVSPTWNGAIGSEQLQWLQEHLNAASTADEKVVIFCHYPVVPAGNKHNLWNAGELVSLLESYDCVKAYLNGHDHRGGYEFQNGIHYLTIPGMVDTRKESSYAVIDLYENTIVVDGSGRCPDRILP